MNYQTATQQEVLDELSKIDFSRLDNEKLGYYMFELNRIKAKIDDSKSSLETRMDEKLDIEVTEMLEKDPDMSNIKATRKVRSSKDYRDMAYKVRDLKSYKRMLQAYTSRIRSRLQEIEQMKIDKNVERKYGAY